MNFSRWIIVIFLLIACDNDNTESRLVRAEKAFKNKNYESALNLFEQYIFDQPLKNVERAQTGLNWTRIKCSDHYPNLTNTAFIGFQGLLTIAPDSEDIKYGYAITAYARKSNLNQAIIYLDDILDDQSYSFYLRPAVDEKQIYYLKSQIHYYNEEFDSALAALSMVYTLFGETLDITNQTPNYEFVLGQRISENHSRMTF